jgi:predicted nucleotidyltransferase
MSTEERIVAYLKNTYSPVAIVLHGSRATGNERLHSDWDVYMLFDTDIPRKGFREQIEGEDVEWKAFEMPIEPNSILDVFDVHLQGAKVLWEQGSHGTDLLERSRLLYAQGPKLSAEDIKREKLFFNHKIAGMEDDKGTPYLFLRHLSVLFARASNLWFEILHNEFSKPLYTALPFIKEKDPEYYKHLMTLCSSEQSNDEKIDAAHRISDRLFLLHK